MKNSCAKNVWPVLGMVGRLPESSFRGFKHDKWVLVNRNLHFSTAKEKESDDKVCISK